jgi:hypothetical protein
MRVSATVWWFFPTFDTDKNLLTLQDNDVSFPPKRHRPHPRSNGSDLLGRFFVEPDLGVCCITKLGPVLQQRMTSRAQRLALDQTDKPIALGLHHTLYYKCVQTREEFYSSVDEITQWIQNGPLLQPPAEAEPLWCIYNLALLSPAGSTINEPSACPLTFKRTANLHTETSATQPLAAYPQRQGLLCPFATSEEKTKGARKLKVFISRKTKGVETV